MKRLISLIIFFSFAAVSPLELSNWVQLLESVAGASSEPRKSLLVTANKQVLDFLMRLHSEPQSALASSMMIVNVVHADTKMFVSVIDTFARIYAVEENFQCLKKTLLLSSTVQFKVGIHVNSTQVIPFIVSIPQERARDTSLLSNVIGKQLTEYVYKPILDSICAGLRAANSSVPLHGTTTKNLLSCTDEQQRVRLLLMAKRSACSLSNAWLFTANVQADTVPISLAIKWRGIVANLSSKYLIKLLAKQRQLIVLNRDKPEFPDGYLIMIPSDQVVPRELLRSVCLDPLLLAAKQSGKR